MSRYSPQPVGISFGPGPMGPAVRAIIYTNVAVWIVMFFLPESIAKTFVDQFALMPKHVVEHGRVWQLATYLFLHSPTQFMHILFNMLAVWMFGVDLERRWGTRGFTKYYFITGIGAAVSVVLVSLLPFEATHADYGIKTVGASGSVYGLLMAWALLYPNRPILFMMMFPLPVRVYTLIIGGIAFFSAIGASGSGVSNLAHLGGLIVGWFYLKGPRDFRLEFQYRLTKWRMERMRRRFNVHRGGRDDWENRIH